MTADAATPAPAETRDWTFVTRERCAECGFDPADLLEEDVPDRIRATIDKWSQVLSRPRPALTARPAADVWSPLEYAGHVRDVCGTFNARLALILDTAVSDTPDLDAAEVDPARLGTPAGARFAARFADWDQNRAQVQGLYNDADPAALAAEYRAAANALASSFGQVADEQWDLQGLRGDGAVFTTRTLAAYLVHDLEHHLVDVG